MEDKIRRLCLELLAETSDEEAGPILNELRVALHKHIELLRERFSTYPFFVERRARNGISAPNERGQKDGAKETGASG